MIIYSSYKQCIMVSSACLCPVLIFSAYNFYFCLLTDGILITLSCKTKQLMKLRQINGVLMILAFFLASCGENRFRATISFSKQNTGYFWRVGKWAGCSDFGQLQLGHCRILGYKWWQMVYRYAPDGTGERHIDHFRTSQYRADRTADITVSSAEKTCALQLSRKSRRSSPGVFPRYVIFTTGRMLPLQKNCGYGYGDQQLYAYGQRGWTTILLWKPLW